MQKKRGAKKGKLNPSWKGNNVGYASLHEWISNYKKKPDTCECCKVKPPYDLANISQQYKRDINDFEWLCRSCHMKKDGRMTKLHKKILKPIPCFICKKVFTPRASGRYCCSRQCGLKKMIQTTRLNNNYQTKLSDEDVRMIWELLLHSKISHERIGNLFGVTRRSIANIKNNKTWQHLNLKYSTPLPNALNQ